jgi:tetratricopeptide (TPR) repeat protein
MTDPIPICFMIMPFGKKKTDPGQASAPTEVDFDALWDKAIYPAIKDIGFRPVRADKDLGSMIIKDMLERLVLSDLVLAEVSIANANVYYEVGVRHAAKEKGCVMIGAEWAKPLFDLGQMRRVPYALTDGTVPDDQAAAIRATLSRQLNDYVNSKTPVYELEGYPNLKPDRASVFASFVDDLANFQQAIRAVRLTPGSDSKAKAIALAARFPVGNPLIPSIALELMYLLRDCAGWKEMGEFVDRLPKGIQDLDVVREQRALATANLGDPISAIAALLQLIATNGDTSERRGLLGGRYKDLYKQSKLLKDLSSAIEQYDKGMYLDLNDYYPSSNLPRLLKLRNRKGDAERARVVSSIVVAACERAKRKNSTDPWLRQTLLGAAFDAGDADEAENLLDQVKDEGPVGWQLEASVEDLKLSADQCLDSAGNARLRAVLDQLIDLLPPEKRPDWSRPAPPA